MSKKLRTKRVYLGGIKDSYDLVHDLSQSLNGNK
tara:strand:+ start:1150 stop:1251 length:102 start_codon:yes stop_codon:yes gene_type:complete